MGRRKKNKVNKAVGQEDSHMTLKVLCFMSFVGFIIAMLVDTGNFISFSSVDELKAAVDQTQYEQLENQIEQWEGVGIDTSRQGLNKIGTMYALRTFIDVLAMVGVVFMFYRLRFGYFIYTLFQFIYVAIPFLFFGGVALLIVPYSSVAITLIYVALFTTQRKHLNR
jgi:hypothetical protein